MPKTLTTSAAWPAQWGRQPGSSRQAGARRTISDLMKLCSPHRGGPTLTVIGTPLPAPRPPPGSPRTHKVHPPPDLCQHETAAHCDGKAGGSLNRPSERNSGGQYVEAGTVTVTEDPRL